jgi:hypothetical protein
MYVVQFVTQSLIDHVIERNFSWTSARKKLRPFLKKLEVRHSARLKPS